MLTKHLMQLGPGLRGTQVVKTLPLHPADQAFGARLALHIGGPILPAGFPDAVIVWLEMKGFF
jgi:hypothetical protein